MIMKNILKFLLRINLRLVSGMVRYRRFGKVSLIQRKSRAGHLPGGDLACAEDHRVGSGRHGKHESAAGAQGGDGCRRYRLPARGAVGRRAHARGVARLVPRVRYSVAR